jgi:hypothetical protein
MDARITEEDEKLLDMLSDGGLSLAFRKLLEANMINSLRAFDLIDIINGLCKRKDFTPEDFKTRVHHLLCSFYMEDMR